MDSTRTHARTHARKGVTKQIAFNSPWANQCDSEPSFSYYLWTIVKINEYAKHNICWYMISGNSRKARPFWNTLHRDLLVFKTGDFFPIPPTDKLIRSPVVYVWWSFSNVLKMLIIRSRWKWGVPVCLTGRGKDVNIEYGNIDGRKREHRWSKTGTSIVKNGNIMTGSSILF